MVAISEATVKRVVTTGGISCLSIATSVGSNMEGGLPMPTEYQSRDAQLHRRICRCIDERWLPVYLPRSISASHGSGSKCYACDQAIDTSEVEYGVRDPRNGTARLSLHLGCYVIWQLECVKRIRQQQKDGSSTRPVPSAGSSKKIVAETDGQLP